MPAKLKKYIVIDKEILGGTPVVAGTRIPIKRLSALIRQGYNSDALKKEYPHVSTKKLQYIISNLMDFGLDEFSKAKKIQLAA